jgi:hypothetical protein
LLSFIHRSNPHSKENIMNATLEELKDAALVASDALYNATENYTNSTYKTAKDACIAASDAYIAALTASKVQS